MDAEPRSGQAEEDATSDRSQDEGGRRSRLEERRGGRRERGGAPWLVGAILIVVGLYLALREAVGFELTNWWALFIMIPALAALGSAWRAYQAAGGRLTAAARGELIAGLILIMVTAIFLFNLAWGTLGPILLILAGIGVLLNALLPG